MREKTQTPMNKPTQKRVKFNQMHFCIVNRLQHQEQHNK